MKWALENDENNKRSCGLQFGGETGGGGGSQTPLRDPSLRQKMHSAKSPLYSEAMTFVHRGKKKQMGKKKKLFVELAHSLVSMHL